MNQSRKILALSLAILLMMGLFPTSGFAAKGEEPYPETHPLSSATQEQDEAFKTTDSSLLTESEASEDAPDASAATPPSAATLSSIATLSSLFGHDLAAYLRAIVDDAEFADAIFSLTSEQIESLLAVVSEEELYEWSLRLPPPELHPDLDADPDGTSAPPFNRAGPLPGFGRSMQRAIQAVSSGVKTPIDRLELTKSADALNDGTYRLTLTAKAAGSLVASETPADLVLAFDTSFANASRINAYKAAAKELVEELAQVSPHSRVAVVSYDAGESSSTSYMLLPVIDSTGSVNAALLAAVDSVSVGGLESIFARSDLGLESAAKIFRAPESSGNRAVILFSSGSAGAGLWGTPALSTVQNTIHWASILKGSGNVNVDYKQTFYGVPGLSFAFRLFGRWWPIPGTQNQAGYGAAIYAVGLNLPDTMMINEYLYRVSSHCGRGVPDIDNFSSENTRNRTNGYFLTGTSEEDLRNIMGSLAGKTADIIQKVTIKDYISPYFDVVDDGSGIAIKTEGDNTYVEWTDVTVKADGSAFFTGTVILKPKDGFAGGNNVPTNVYGDSAVYSDNGNIGSFENVTVNVPIEFDFKIQDASIYIGQEIALRDLHLSSYDSNAWQYAFIEKPEFSASPSSLRPEKDTVYTITATVKPKYVGTSTDAGEPNSTSGISFSKEGATVHVFRPEFQTTPGTMFLGETLNLSTLVKADQWVCGDESVLPPGDDLLKPVLTFTLAPDSTGSLSDTKFTPTRGGQYTFTYQAKIGDTDVTPDNNTVTVTVATGTLTIKKSGAKPGESYIAIINWSGGKDLKLPDGYTFPLYVAVTGGSVTVTGLPAGQYSVAEDTNWSWRYKDSSFVEPTSGKLGGGDASSITFTIKNNSRILQWLSGEASRLWSELFKTN